MTNETPIRGLEPKLICTDCQQRALDRVESQTEGYLAVFEFCESAGRSLIVEGMDGAPWRWQVSRKADRASLEATWQSWCRKRGKALEIGAAVVERKQAEIDGERLQ